MSPWFHFLPQLVKHTLSQWCYRICDAAVYRRGACWGQVPVNAAPSGGGWHLLHCGYLLLLKQFLKSARFNSRFIFVLYYLIGDSMEKNGEDQNFTIIQQHVKQSHLLSKQIHQVSDQTDHN